MSILFIDIQEFSSISESHDPRVVNDMVEYHFSRYLDCITRHGGEVNETSGDGLMVIFKENYNDTVYCVSCNNLTPWIVLNTGKYMKPYESKWWSISKGKNF